MVDVVTGYLQINANLRGEALELPNDLVLLAVDQEETISSPAAEEEADQLKNSGDEGKAVDSADDGVEEVEDKDATEACGNNAGLLLRGVPPSNDLLPKFCGAGSHSVDNFLAGLLDLILLEGTHDVHAAGSTYRGTKYTI